MLVHQAIYGDDGGAHALLMHSAAAAGPFADLAWKTDLPGTAPPEAPWGAFVSGFPHGGFYVLVKTFPDPAASRGGMVLSHALFLPLDEACCLRNLRSATNLFLSGPVRPSSLRAAEIGASGESAAPASAGLGGLAEALVTLGGGAPVVWVGQDGFAEAILSLWTTLWPEACRTFHFRLSFGPQDCQEATPAVVCTPAILESRWVGYRLVHPARNDEAVSEAAQRLLGLPGGEALRGFEQEVGAELARLSDLALLERCRRYAASQAATPDECLALVRLLSHLSPRPDKGTAPKYHALKHLAEMIPLMLAAEVRALRNLDLAAFASGPQAWAALAEWAERGAVARAGSDPEIATVLGAAAANTPTASPWQEAILRGLGRAAASAGPAFAAAVWRWWSHAPAFLEALADRLPDDPALEVALADTCPPSLGRDVADRALRHAARRRWYRLHGAAAAAGLDPATAVELQLGIDVDPSHTAGLQTALRLATAGQVIAAALRWKDPRLVALAAQTCVTATAQLQGLEVDDPTWLAILTAALEQDSTVWRDLTEPQIAMGHLLDRSIRGGAVPRGLWAALARTPLGDLSERPLRGEIWGQLPAEARTPLLARTADGWLERFSVRPDADPCPEPELHQALLQEARIGPFLHGLIPMRIGIGAQLFLRFDALAEGRFDGWLTAVLSATAPTRAVPAPDAALLGRLVQTRKWRPAAARLANAVARERRSDLRPALSECHSLLGLWERLKLTWQGGLELPPPNVDELWQLLEQTACELYADGPDDNEIWSRAGGEGSALRPNGTGQALWREAFRLLRNGGGNITAARLLATMREEYAGNERLRWLACQNEFQGPLPD